MMGETMTNGGFSGDPTAALSVSGAGGCCGNPPQALTRTDVGSGTRPTGATATAPCCGTSAEAQGSGGCCGTQAKVDAVAGGAGCCG